MEKGGEGHTRVILTALMPHVVQALVKSDANAVVDGFEGNVATAALGDVADNVEYREHWLLGVGLARQGPAITGSITGLIAVRSCSLLAPPPSIVVESDVE